MPVIGFLNVASTREFARQVANFHKGLVEAGFVSAIGWANQRSRRYIAA
jgi:uncharacterized protein (DUF697 family)